MGETMADDLLYAIKNAPFAYGCLRPSEIMALCLQMARNFLEKEGVAVRQTINSRGDRGIRNRARQGIDKFGPVLLVEGIEKDRWYRCSRLRPARTSESG